MHSVESVACFLCKGHRHYTCNHKTPNIKSLNLCVGPTVKNIKINYQQLLVLNKIHAKYMKQIEAAGGIKSVSIRIILKHFEPSKLQACKVEKKLSIKKEKMSVLFNVDKAKGPFAGALWELWERQRAGGC